MMLLSSTAKNLRTCFEKRNIVALLQKYVGVKYLSTSQINSKFYVKGGIAQEIHNVTVVGGGVMGSGIAQVCAQSGCRVTVVDTDEYAQRCIVSIVKTLETLSLQKFPYEPKSARKFITDVLGCVETTQSVQEGCENADLVIEAIIEDIDIKQEMFRKLDMLAPPHAIIASNTSSLSIEDIGALAKHRDRIMGLHFFNPAWKMRAVEVIATRETSPEMMDKMLSFVRDIGKVPVKCKVNDETAGFIVNSLIFPYLLEALRFLEQGTASIEDIDTAMKLGAGLPSGPFEWIDMLGVDDLKFVVDRWHAKYPDNPKYYPSEILNKMYHANKLGMKSGEGFYTYRPRIKKNKHAAT